MQRWLWVTRPEVYTTKPLRVHEQFTWTCHSGSTPGDIALLYRAEPPFQDLSHVFRIESDPYDDPDLAVWFGSDTGCECVLVAALQCPVRLDQIRDDPVLAQWPAARVNFHGTAFPLDEVYWDSFLKLTDPLDTQHLCSLR
jgi:hypothetical protein